MDHPAGSSPPPADTPAGPLLPELIRAESLMRDSGLLGTFEGTVLLVRGATVDEVAAAVGALAWTDVPADEVDAPEPAWSDFALVPVERGALALEHSGYADPPNAVLRQLSRDGRTAAVVRSNHQGRVRFGYARDGELLFDSDEYVYVEDRSSVPDEIRSLLDLVSDDLTEEVPTQREDPVAVGLAMAETVTGVLLTRSDLAALEGEDARRLAAPALRYWGQED